MAESAEHPARCVLIFGGTFDPPHLAHTTLPSLAAQQLGCEEIVYVPAAINPLKMGSNEPPPTAPEHRVAMLLLAIADIPNARISTIELDRAAKGQVPSYMIDTLHALRAEYDSQSASPRAAAHVGSAARSGSSGGAHSKAASSSASTAAAASMGAPPSFRLLIGADQALEFHRWKKWQDILMLATPAVMLRPPWDERTYREALAKKYSPVEAECWLRWTLMRGLPRMDISATEIRRRLKTGEPLTGMIDPAVEQYIRANGLYGSAKTP